MTQTPTRTQTVAPVSNVGFGTFGGVFTPSILTILGVIMYLRYGWVVGNVGVGNAMIVVVVAHLITAATGLSISSIATNRTVRTGGAYFIISRSLGAPAGAAIGIPLFLGQALSITFYIVGFTESLGYIFPDLPVRIISSVVCLLLALLTFKGADLAIKAQYIVMSLIGLSLLAFFLGPLIGNTETAPKQITWWQEGHASFGEVFSVFFPAVTGIMAGVGMSGDLKDPRKSIPLGTMLAIGTGFVVYMIIPIWLGANAEMKVLRNNPNVMWSISALPALIYAGVWGATLSSAIGSFLTAPRTLQALAYDRLAPRIFARGSGPSNEPRIGIAFTFVLASVGLMLGSLDAIANLLTMFFLATYGFTNLACGLEKWAANPSFRPEFRVPAFVSLAGGLACFYVMSQIDPKAMVGAFAIGALIWVIVQRRNLEATWGDARHGIWSALVRTALYRLRRVEFHPLNWRPNLLILGGGVRKRLHLLELGSTIVQDRGIVSYMNLLRGSVTEKAEERRQVFKSLDETLGARFPHVFCRVDIVDDLYKGMVTVSQSYGLGNFEANTVMLGWPKKPERQAAYVETLRDLARLDRSLLLVHWDPQKRLGTAKKIQIWWGGMQNNGGLMLLLAYLITAHHRWRKAQVEVVTVVNRESEVQRTEEGIRKVLESARLHASPKVSVRDARPMKKIMENESRSADLAIVGMRLPDEKQDPETFFERMNTLLSVLPTTILVHSARDFQGEPVLFDDDGGQSDPPATNQTAAPEAAKPTPEEKAVQEPPSS